MNYIGRQDVKNINHTGNLCAEMETWKRKEMMYQNISSENIA